jgi:hypothetical protein
MTPCFYIPYEFIIGILTINTVTLNREPNEIGTYNQSLGGFWSEDGWVLDELGEVWKQHALG